MATASASRRPMTQARPLPSFSKRPQRGKRHEERIAHGLGWFSIGLGLVELAMPRTFAHFIGVPERTKLLRAFGLREIAAGVGILAQRRPAAWMWSRVAGDCIDLAGLCGACLSDQAKPNRIAAAFAAVAGITLLDLANAQELTERADSRTEQGNIRVRKSVLINRPREELYQYWQDLENLPRFMSHLRSVEVLEGGHSRWVVNAPAGMTVEWVAEITSAEPNDFLAWRSLPGAEVEHSGAVRFEPGPGGRGTIIHVELRYDPPAGTLGALFAKLLGEEPGQHIQEDLRRLKQVLETGEIATTKGQPQGQCAW